MNVASESRYGISQSEVAFPALHSADVNFPFSSLFSGIIDNPDHQWYDYPKSIIGLAMDVLDCDDRIWGQPASYHNIHSRDNGAPLHWFSQVKREFKNPD